MKLKTNLQALCIVSFGSGNKKQHSKHFMSTFKRISLST